MPRRTRLTITLKTPLVKRLDNMVDGEKIRNRSHAVEYLLSQTLLPKDAKVLILAGGAGVAFRPFTYEIPKAMIPVSGKPLLEHTIEKLRQSNLNNIIILTGHLGNKIKNYFGDGSKWGLNISYLEQKSKQTGTAQPLAQAENQFSSSFLLIYGDVLAQINYQDLIDFHHAQRGVTTTMALTSQELVSMWGVAKLVGNKIVEFDEKPKTIRTKSHLVNAGIYMMEPNIFKYISAKTKRLESEVLPRLAEEGKLVGYPFEGDWYDLATPKIYEQVIKEWKK